ncbi:NAD(P)H-dependent oxidoreductase [Mycoplasmatota bacterium WC30]
MSLIVYNGSPRGERSNSSVIVSWFLEGYGKENVEIRFLKNFNHHRSYAEEMSKYNQVLMVFPLYVDGMPGQVKNFFEILSTFKETLKDKQVAYIIHSGFSDGIQCGTLEQYLIRFSNIMHFDNHGVIVIPGSEGFRLYPPSMVKRKKEAVSSLAVSYKANEPFNKSDLNLLFGKEKSSAFSIFIYKLLSLFGITNMYWNSRLKKNKAYKNRFDAPYKDNPTTITSENYISNK